MLLTSISLHNFRSYTKKEFSFTKTTIIVGPNTSGKTNLVEAILLLSTGKSTRFEKDMQAIRFGAEMARIRGICHPELVSGSEIPDQVRNDTQLEAVLTNGMVSGVPSPLKRYLINGVAKRRVDFASHLPTVSFSPSDLDIIIGSPILRRSFLDDVLEQVDRGYRIAVITYGKALRQRNALLDLAKETGMRSEKQFTYWDSLLITHGSYIHQKRQAFIDYINESAHEVFPLRLTYDHSVISPQRLLQYKDAEMGSGVTLVGPHRDDFFVAMKVGKELKNVKAYGSRGQQRLVILQLKLLQLLYIEKEIGQRPLLLLDDIFSELDSSHIALVQTLLGKQQTIMTTTHKEFLDKKHIASSSVIELKEHV